MNIQRQPTDSPPTDSILVAKRLLLAFQPPSNPPMDADQRRAVAAILRHDQESSGAELVYYFVHELGVAERTAWQAVANRAGFRF
jgi:hypothetical protein